ncbi:MAG: DUF4331 family protein [Methanotrichaceae archaeon]
MSNHLDSPLARKDTRLDITDVYLFRGTMGTVFVMNVNSSVAGQRYPEHFHPEALYEFKVDTDGDAVEDMTFRVSFGHNKANGRQALELRRLDGMASRDRNAEGTILAQGLTGDNIIGEGGVRIWAGIAGEPFYIEPTVLGAIRKAVASGTAVDLTGWNRDKAVNAFAGTTVSSIVIEVPDGTFGVTTIGFWGTTALATDNGGWQQINREGQPMIQPIFNPDDSERSSAYNTTQPREDRAIYGPLVSKLVAGIIAAMGTSDDPQAYGELVAALCFPDILHYEIGTPAVFGFAKRNGRALTDNAPEVMFSIVVNAALSDGLHRGSATGTLRPDFPYVALPVSPGK